MCQLQAWHASCSLAALLPIECSKKEIIMEMQRCCDAKSSYAEEACRAGMVHVLTGILSTTGAANL